MITEFRTSFINIRAISFGTLLTPSTRYRLLQFIPGLEKLGVSIDVKSSNEISNWAVFVNFIYTRKSGSVDFFWIQKKLLSPFRVWLLSKNFKIIYDFDDAIWTSERDGRSYFTKWLSAKKIQYVLKKSSLVIAGNNYLADYAGLYASKIVVLPTVVNVRDYPLKIHSDENLFTLGWIGQSVNFNSLKKLHGIFLKLREYTEFKLIVIADKNFYLDGVLIENRRWSLETEISDILDIDVGLMPLEDSEWTRGKCAFKAIQYMAAGIPPIASNVGVNKELIVHGVSGFLPTNYEDWISKILLLKSLTLRSSIGACARDVVQSRFSLESVEALIFRIISDLKGVN